MAGGMPFRRAFAQVSKAMGPVGSHFTIRALTTSEALYGRFQKDLPERRATAIRLVSEGATYAQAATEVRLSKGTVARLWREWRAYRGN
jgi:DNA-binding NarL/FixJ family response regulator